VKDDAERVARAGTHAAYGIVALSVDEINAPIARDV